MSKIDKLFTEVDRRNRGKIVPTGYDPETRTFFSKVEYTPLKDLRTNMEEFEKDFEKAIKQYPDDTKLADYLQALKKFNRGLRSHITRNYKGKE